MPAAFLYLIRPAATEAEANLALPPRLQGCRHDPPLACLGVCQAEATRDRLAGNTFHCCYCSSLLRAVQTATILAALHSLTPQPLDALVECDVGDWEGRTWDDIRHSDSEAYARFLACPGTCPYLGGECLQNVHQRVAPVLEELLTRHAGQNILVVTHQIVLRAYLAPLLGLTLDRTRQVILPNAGGYLVSRQGVFTMIRSLDIEDSITAPKSAMMHAHGTDEQT